MSLFLTETTLYSLLPGRLKVPSRFLGPPQALPTVVLDHFLFLKDWDLKGATVPEQALQLTLEQPGLKCMGPCTCALFGIR